MVPKNHLEVKNRVLGINLNVPNLLAEKPVVQILLHMGNSTNLDIEIM